MDRKLFGIFSGTHLTILASLAILAPGALYAIPSFTNVAIEDPISGSRALVDPGRRLSVNDPTANYRNFPGNFVRILQSADPVCKNIYNVPAGRALVVETVTTISKAPSAGGFVYLELYEGPKSKPCTSDLALSYAGDTPSTITLPLGPGATVHAGHALGLTSTSGGGIVQVYGYLVPAAVVPAADSAEAAAQNVGLEGSRNPSAGRP